MQMTKQGDVKDVPAELADFMGARGWEPATGPATPETPSLPDLADLVDPDEHEDDADDTDADGEHDDTDPKELA